MAWPTWESVFFAEIEKFPSKVLAHHWPNVPNLGDITAPDFIDRAKQAIGPERLDVFAGGTPCQAFSFAGKRESLNDARGNLSLRFVELCDAIDPRLVVWENVPGVLNTDDNAFGCFIGKLVGSSHPLRHGRTAGGWPYSGMVAGPRRLLSWRVVDAQYCHLAQRRERVLVVAGRVGDGTDPGAILFESEVVRRDSPPSREARTQIAGCSAQGVGIDGGDVGHCVTTRPGQRMNADAETMVVTHTLTGEGFDASEDGTGRGTPIIPVARRSRNGEVVYELGEPNVMPTIMADNVDRHAMAMAPIIPIQEPGCRTGRSENDSAHGMGIGADGDVMYTLGAGHPHGVGVGMTVRRITPREAERLQGMPDDHTLIPGASDSPRYKAIGNAWARNVFAWLGNRIERHLEKQ